MISWKFPSNNGGQINGIANAGIETFNGRLLQSLARENCQNSLDAVREDQDCAIVEINMKTIPSSLFPGREQMLAIFENALLYWKSNEKAYNFLYNAVETLKRQNMEVLIISDYNTTGLTGAFSNDINSNWSALTKLDGGATKSGNTGGSYGIGKHAPFANSKFRTVFYRTQTESETAVQGISRIISYPEDLNDAFNSMTTGVGYYGDENGNKPVEHIAALDNIYNRKDIGTDIFIFGFHDEKGWKEEIIEEVLKNFIVAIYNNHLKVYVDKYEISKETLERNVEHYIKDKPGKDYRSCYSTYLVLTNPNTKVRTKQFHELGTLELKFLIDPELELDRKILRIRKTGMKLFERNPVSKVISYSAILELKGDKIGEYFLKLEPPTHDKWEFDRADKNKNEAKAYIKEIEDWEANIIQENGITSDVEEFSVEGLDDLLSLGDDNGLDHNKRESINDTIDMIKIIPKKRGTFSSGWLYLNNGEEKNNKDRHETEGQLTDDINMPGVRKLKGDRPRKKIEKHTAKPLEGGNDIAIVSNNNLNKMAIENIRIYKVKPRTYKMSFIVPNDIKEGYIEILTIGENNKSKLLLVNSVSAISNIHDLIIDKTRINFTNIQAKEKIQLLFDLADDINYAMEVEVYEHC